MLKNLPLPQALLVSFWLHIRHVFTNFLGLFLMMRMSRVFTSFAQTRDQEQAPVPPFRVGLKISFALIKVKINHKKGTTMHKVVH